MSSLGRHRWRIAVVSLVIGTAVVLSLGSTYASTVQDDASAQVMALSADPTLLKINDDPFTNSTSNHKTQVEPGSFAFGNTIVAAEQSGRFFDGGASDIAYSTSTDGGKTWTTGTLPATVFSGGPYARTSDVTVAYDAKHKTWMMSYLGIKTPNTADVAVSLSIDGGITFGTPVIVSSQGTDLLDKNWTTCDNTPSSPFYGHCYTEFDDNAQLNLVQLSTSTDGGKHWGKPKTTPDQTCVIGGQPLVQPDGTVIMPISDCTESTVLAIRSTDGGETWTEPAFVGQEIFFGPAGNLRAGGLVSADIDKSGKVYVTWPDCRGEGRCTLGVDDLLLSTSTNGVKWSTPQRIPIAPLASTVEPTLPGLGIDHNSSGDDAHLGLTYYFYPNGVDPTHSTFCSTDTCQLETGFISSTNGGKTWSKPQTLAGPMNLRWLPLTSQGFMVADYIATSLVSHDDGSTAFPIFMVASKPTAGTSCSGPAGEAGQHCVQPTFTVTGGISIGGGEEAATPALSSSAAAAPSGAPVTPLQIPDDRGGLSKPHTAN